MKDVNYWDYRINRDKRNYKGKDFRLENDILEYGYKFHMNDINATIGVYNFPYIDNLLKKNRANSLYFDQHLKDIDGIKLTKTIQNVILHIGFIVFVYCMVKKKNSWIKWKPLI